MKKINLVIAVFIAAAGFTSCIGSKEAYDKSKLSGFVATQTKQIIKETEEAKAPGVDLSKMIQETNAEVKALDADMNQAQAEIDKLEAGLAKVEKLEAEAKAEFERSNVTSVFFALSSSTLTPEAMQELYRWKSGLDRAGSQFNYNVVVYASADKSGSAKTNEILRNKRADAVKKFLISLGVNAAKVSVVTTQPAFSVANNLDRRAVVGVTVAK